MVNLQVDNFPICVNPSLLEIIIDKNGLSDLFFSNHQQILTSVKFDRIKLDFTNFYEIESIKISNPSIVNYNCLVNVKLISYIGRYSTFFPVNDQFLIYDDSVRLPFRWSEDTDKKNIYQFNPTIIVMLSGVMIPCHESIISIVSKFTRGIKDDDKKECKEECKEEEEYCF